MLLDVWEREIPIRCVTHLLGRVQSLTGAPLLPRENYNGVDDDDADVKDERLSVEQQIRCGARERSGIYPMICVRVCTL